MFHIHWLDFRILAILKSIIYTSKYLGHQFFLIWPPEFCLNKYPQGIYIQLPFQKMTEAFMNNFLLIYFL